MVTGSSSKLQARLGDATQANTILHGTRKRTPTATVQVLGDLDWSRGHTAQHVSSTRLGKASNAHDAKGRVEMGIDRQRHQQKRRPGSA